MLCVARYPSSKNIGCLRLVNIYFSQNKLAGSSQARFLAKKPPYLKETTVLCESIHWIIVKKCQNRFQWKKNQKGSKDSWKYRVWHFSTTSQWMDSQSTVVSIEYVRFCPNLAFGTQPACFVKSKYSLTFSIN